MCGELKRNQYVNTYIKIYMKSINQKVNILTLTLYLTTLNVQLSNINDHGPNSLFNKRRSLIIISIYKQFSTYNVASQINPLLRPSIPGWAK